MLKHSQKLLNIGWNFDNSYSRLPNTLLSKLKPVPVRRPQLVILNKNLSNSLGLNLSGIDMDVVASLFSGNLLPKGSVSIAQAYAGHQFGYFTTLGDGRAILLGEHLALSGDRFDIQLKGSGQTPYSRGGDGRAALGPVLREYIVSEAMYALGIPTTRSLAAVSTGESVFRETSLPGAILTRVASSHLRIGTFQYVAMMGNLKTLGALVNYAINRHYCKKENRNTPGLSLLKIVTKKQTQLVTEWMRVGFVHGVMNTDNMTISGETIDYGPCAFMDAYDPETVFSSIDLSGRYAFHNQPSVVHWNLLRFAEALLPLIHENKDRAIKAAEDVINIFPNTYKYSWVKMMRKKLGLFGEKREDEVLINDLLSWMRLNKADYTNTFRLLSGENLLKEKTFQGGAFLNWYLKWKNRIKKNNKPKKSSIDLMRANNPEIIPRNHIVEEVLDAAGLGDMDPVHRFIDVLKSPYKKGGGILKYQTPPKTTYKEYKTFCGT